MTADLFYEIVCSLWQYACIDADTHQMKEKSKFPLHTAIEHGREDVVFLFLIEYDTQLKSKVNEVDDKGHLPIELALHLGHESIANTLVKSTLTSFQVDFTRTKQIQHAANIDLVVYGSPMLVHFIKNNDLKAAMFLIKVFCSRGPDFED